MEKLYEDFNYFQNCKNLIIILGITMDSLINTKKIDKGRHSEIKFTLFFTLIYKETSQ